MTAMLFKSIKIILFIALLTASTIYLAGLSHPHVPPVHAPTAQDTFVRNIDNGLKVVARVLDSLYHAQQQHDSTP